MIAQLPQTRFWALADTHLSFAKPKPMARFGGTWVDHEITLQGHWHERVAPDDVVLLPGDISWAQTPTKVWPDLMWLRALPGRKVLLRGNHDHWWKRVEDVRKIVEPMNFYALDGDSLTLDGVVIAGAMGHLAPHDPYYKVDAKKDRYSRELDRLERALQHASLARLSEAGASLPVILLMHYPPFTSDGQPTAYAEIIERYCPTLCLYGHLHHQSEWDIAVQGERNGVHYRLVAADYIEMKPRLVWPMENDE
jgi:uncharacterized protein